MPVPAALSKYGVSTAFIPDTLTADTAADGVILDMQALNIVNVREIRAIYSISIGTGGTVTVTVEQGDESNLSDATAITGATSGAVAADGSGVVSFTVRQRYARVVMTDAGGAGDNIGAAVLEFLSRSV